DQQFLPHRARGGDPKMKKFLLSIIVLSLAACSHPSEQELPANNSAAAEEKADVQAPIPSIEGEWVVELTNGKAPDQIWPMTAEATKDHFTILSECRKM